MNTIERDIAGVNHWMRRARWLVLACCLWLSASSIAWGAPKKRKEVSEGPATKSYALPYAIVIMVVGLGLMTVCRASRRKDKPEEKIKDDE